MATDMIRYGKNGAYVESPKRVRLADAFPSNGLSKKSPVKAIPAHGAQKGQKRHRESETPRDLGAEV